MRKTMYLIGGGLNLAFAVFHAFFYEIFEWNETLGMLSPVNRGIMLVLNNSGITLCLGFALLSFLFARDFATNKIGRAVSVFIAAVFLIRAIEEPIYFGIYDIVGIATVAVCMLAVVLYLVPLFIGEKQPVHSPA